MFLLQFAEFNLKAPPYSKTLITWEFPFSSAPTLFRSFYSQDRKNSSHVIVALEKCKILIFLSNFFLLLRPLLLKAQFNSVSADILKNHGMHPVPLGQWSKLPGFSISLVKSFFPPPIICKENDSVKSLPCSGLLLPLYELMKFGVLAKWTLKWP